MQSQTLSIQPFEAVYPIKQMGGGEHWMPCQVIGVMTPDSCTGYGKFIILIEGEDGVLTVDVAENVQRM